MLEADMRKENQPAHLGSGAVRVILASPCCLIHRFPDHKKVFFKKGGRSARAGEWSLWCCGDTAFLG